MGLASALTTALTGLTAAETQIDVVGNNLANSQTVGFKASTTVFSTQFLQTLGLGSAPTTTTGGTNPRQTGLGVQVAEVTPDFTQGTIEISSNPADLAVQGDGFFMVEGTTGETLYTRNGMFKTNSENQLVTVTGNRLLGFGVDDLFTLQTTELTSLTIPLGSTSVAQATQNVYLQGTMTPVGDVADTAEVLESAVLGNAAIPRPDTAAAELTVPSGPSTAATTSSIIEGAGGTHAPSATYRYKFTFADDSGSESVASSELTVTVPLGNGLPDDSIVLGSLPDSSAYALLNIYRTTNGGSNYFLLDTVPTVTGGGGAATYTDDNSIALSATELNTDLLNGNYNYLVTFYKDGEVESRPSPLIGPKSVVNGRIRITDLPTPPVPGPTDDFPAYNKVRIYRNTVSDSSSFYLVTELDPGDTFTDHTQDDELTTNAALDMDGPKANPNTLLTNILVRDELSFEQIFTAGTLSFAARKGGRGLTAKEMTVTSTTTLQELIDFMEDASGIQKPAADPQNPIPSSLNTIDDSGDELAPGASVLASGKIRFVSNNGVDNAMSIGLSALTLTDDDEEITNPSLGFGSVQSAVGQSAVADFLVYDSLGTALNVRVTAVLEERTGSATVYRWFADSPNNDPLVGSEIAIGTGLVSFDGEGNFVSATNSTVSIDRRNVPAASPLEIDLDFSQISGLAESSSSLAASRQDGSPPGTLTSFTIGEDGMIRGVFDNGIARTLGQVRLARFTNPSGLEQRGQNMYTTGANSGLPVEGNPGENGLGSLIAGAVELSNTDIGQNLIDLVLATTQYRGNTRVITTAQQLIEELLNLRR
ncbi:MAG: flagellar hook-basal body complex protein [Planctomycetes bacterium]|nr:flagellar hook-basal body complex protein [Planctomycetota bacterium]